MTREQVTGKRFWGTLPFVTYVVFFPFTYLIDEILNSFAIRQIKSKKKEKYKNDYPKNIT
ncbi:MAG: hypothetical protein ACK5HC_19000 [Dolichospermum sp.]|jgi:hypothetical protein|nr:hypothetical protein [Anabaena sp. 49628_E55]